MITTIAIAQATATQMWTFLTSWRRLISVESAGR